MEPGPQYASFLLIVVPSDESFDFAVSRMDSGTLFLLTPGMRFVVAAPFTKLAVSGPEVLAAKPLADGSLSIVTVLSPGHAGVSYYTGLVTGFGIDVLVRPAATRYDAVLSNQDVGRTIHAKVGQTIQFRLVETPGYGRWVGGSYYGFFVRPLIDPSAGQEGNAPIAYEIVGAYHMPLQLLEEPDCFLQPSCKVPWRTIAFDVEATA